MQTSSSEQGLISVIIPVYNVKPYLTEAIESVIGQTYPFVEIILVDDGSTDGSGEMCDRFAEMNNQIKVIHQKNRGLSAARNAGLDLCRGDAITFLDPDDAFRIDMLSKMYRAMQKTGADIVECNYSGYKSAGRMNPKCIHDRPRGISNRSRKKGVYDCRKALRMHLEGLITNNVWNKLYNKKIWEELRFREGQNFEDIDIVLPTIERAEKICILNSVLVMHRKRRGSITSTRSINNLKDRITSLRHYRDYVQSHIPLFFEECHLKMVEERFYSALIREYNRCTFERFTYKKEYVSLLKREIVHIQGHINLKECSTKLRLVSWFFNNTPQVVSGMVYWIYRPFWMMKKVSRR